MIYSLAVTIVLFLNPLSGIALKENMVLRVQLLRDDKGDDGLLKPRELHQSIEVDLTGFWYHIDQGNLISARDELDRMRDKYLFWEPPYIVEETIRARALFQSGRLQEAAKYLAAPQADKYLKQELSDLFAKRAVKKIELGDWTHAKALGVQAENFGTMDWNKLGWTALDVGEAAGALEFFEKSMGTGHEADAMLGRLRSLLALGEIRQAENLARRIGAFDSVMDEIGGLYASKSLTAAKQLRWEEALSLAENAGRLGTQVWIAIGWIAMENDRPDLILSVIADKGHATDPIAATKMRSSVLQSLGCADPTDDNQACLP